MLRLLLATGSGALFVRCTPTPSSDEIEIQIAAYDTGLSCTDTSRLWPAERKTREDNRYRDLSERRLGHEYCFRCENFVAPAEPGTCGTCRTIKGPIHPLGWCKSWALRRA
jgi:hypothetical protein